MSSATRAHSQQPLGHRAAAKIVAPTVVLVTPALADANNGNGQTARRWARMLQRDYRVVICTQWPLQGEGASGKPPASARASASSVEAAPHAMLALHALRSAASIAAFAKAHPDRARLVALTGTDLYRDLATSEVAQGSLALASRIIVLQAQALDAVPAPWRGKTDVCYQSTPARATLPKTTSKLRAVMVGHLRPEKDPMTALRALSRLQARPDIVLDHLGAALDAGLAKQAQALAAQQPSYLWLGAKTHAQALRWIQRAHVLVHPSVMEGGAHVVMEAVQCGTPVLASRMPGNVGMLGAGYRGYFEVGDDAGLAALLVRARDDPAWLAGLAAQCARRAAYFDPAREQATLLAVMKRAMKSP
jgi:putative glycosyltransferase (TIGR04348 family)